MIYRRSNPKSVFTAMSSARRMCLKAALVLAVVGLAGLGSSLRAQNSSSPSAGTTAVDPLVQRNVEDWIAEGKGVPEDWSHHHLVFSNPGTEEDAFKNGTHDQWLNIVNDPRFTLQQIKRSGGVKVLEDAGVSAAQSQEADQESDDNKERLG